MLTATRLACCGAAVVALAGCSGSDSAETASGASVAVADSLETLRPTDVVAGDPVAEISAARNEFESFQVAVNGGSSGLEGVRVSLASPLTGAGGALSPSAVTIYREGYVRVRKPSDLEGVTGRWPDPLIPAVDPFYGERRNAFPVDVPAGENRVAWIDVLVPEGAAPGPYHGAVEVTAAGGFDEQVPIELVVHGFSLPSTSTLQSSFGLYPDPCIAHYGSSCGAGSRRGWRLTGLYERAALDDRVGISDTFGAPTTRASTRAFRRYLLPLLLGEPARAPAVLRPRLPGAALTSLSLESLKDLPAWRREAARDGFSRLAFYYACDEPGGSASEWSRCRHNARRAAGSWPKLPSLVTATLASAKAHGAGRLIDIITPLVNDLDGKPGRASAGDHRPGYDGYLGQPGRRLWMYTACPSYACAGDPSGGDPYWAGWPAYAIDEPATEQRAMGTLSFEYRASGELYYNTVWKLRTAWRDEYAFGGNGDGTLFYAGKPSLIGGRHDIPIDSIRLKRIRDGREDYEYLRLAADSGHDAEAQALARSIYPRMFETDVSPSTVAVARNALATLIDE